MILFLKDLPKIVLALVGFYLIGHMLSLIIMIIGNFIFKKITLLIKEIFPIDKSTNE